MFHSRMQAEETPVGLAERGRGSESVGLMVVEIQGGAAPENGTRSPARALDPRSLHRLPCPQLIRTRVLGGFLPLTLLLQTLCMRPG